MRNWLLPESIDDVLPDEAARLEALRRTLLDHFATHRYRLVQPPLIEHLDSLLTGSGRDLELQTFKVVDPLSGRLLGLRADITPQVARIDAHLLNESGVTRLCYAGSVLRAVASTRARRAKWCRSAQSSSAWPASTAIAKSCRCCCRRLGSGLPGLHVDLGHVGVYRALASGSGVAGNGDEAELFDALRTKDEPAVRALTRALPAAWRDAFAALPMLYGPADDVLGAARAQLPDIPSIHNALAHSTRSPPRQRRSCRHCTSISRTCAAIITRTARSSRCSPPANPSPSATAVATTASARLSGARGRQPVSRSTSAARRRAGARRRE